MNILKILKTALKNLKKVLVYKKRSIPADEMNFIIFMQHSLKQKSQKNIKQ